MHQLHVEDHWKTIKKEAVCTLLIFSSTDMAPNFARAMTSAVGAEEAAGGCAVELGEVFATDCTLAAGLGAIVVAAFWAGRPT